MKTLHIDRFILFEYNNIYNILNHLKTKNQLRLSILFYNIKVFLEKFNNIMQKYRI